jgi:hypothetical protein
MYVKCHATQRITWFRNQIKEVDCLHLIRQYMRDLVVAVRQQTDVAIGPSPTTFELLRKAAWCVCSCIFAMHTVWTFLEMRPLLSRVVNRG